MTGQEAKERRQRLGKPMRVVAARAGVTHPTLSYFERGIHRMHPHLQAALDDALSAFERERDLESQPTQSAA